MATFHCPIHEFPSVTSSVISLFDDDNRFLAPFIVEASQLIAKWRVMTEGRGIKRRNERLSQTDPFILLYFTLNGDRNVHSKGRMAVATSPPRKGVIRVEDEGDGDEEGKKKRNYPANFTFSVRAHCYSA